MRILLVLIAALLLPVGASAQHDKPYYRKVQEFKKQYFTQELELTKAQERSFFPVYFECEQAKHRLVKEARQAEKRLSDQSKPSDAECLEVARSIFDLDTRTGAIDIQYFSKYKEILTPQQLLKLPAVERRFRQMMIDASERYGKDN